VNLPYLGEEMLFELAQEKLHEFKWGSAKSNIAAQLVTLGLATLSNGTWGYYIYRLTPEGKQKAIEIAKRVIK
jgi:hypothetical protein